MLKSCGLVKLDYNALNSNINKVTMSWLWSPSFLLCYSEKDGKQLQTYKDFDAKLDFKSITQSRMQFILNLDLHFFWSLVRMVGLKSLVILMNLKISN